MFVCAFQIHAWVPAPSNGWCLNRKGLLNGTLSHPFGTPWRVQVCFYCKTPILLRTVRNRSSSSDACCPRTRSVDVYGEDVFFPETTRKTVFLIMELYHSMTSGGLDPWPLDLQCRCLKKWENLSILTMILKMGSHSYVLFNGKGYQMAKEENTIRLPDKKHWILGKVC